MNFKLGEFNIVCKDLEKSLHFYQEILGFEFVEKDSGAMRLKFGGNYFLLLPFAKNENIKTPYCENPTFSFDILVDEISEAKKYFLSKGVTIEDEETEISESFWIRDPDNLVIEVVSSSLQ
ncbi:MAG: VOC family protein [Calditrichaeota bacterium]|nr:MAG: VOC family protein [Calditrichota bacterium]